MTEPIIALAITQASRSAPLEVYGVTLAEVEEVALEYVVDGSPEHASAEFLPVTDAEVLRRAAISKPFGYYSTELPAETSDATATALDSEGEEIGSASFDPFLGPNFGYRRSFIGALAAQ